MSSNETIFNATALTREVKLKFTTPHVIQNNLLVQLIVLFFISSGISLNTMYILAYLRRSIANTHFNYCIFHLTITNLFQLIVYIVYARMTTHQLPSTDNWVAESIMCATLNGLSLFWVGAITSGYMLCYMSLIKIILVYNPMQRFKITKKRTGRIFFLLWLISAVEVSPFWFSKKLNVSRTKCIRDYHGYPGVFNFHDRIFNFTGFTIPLFVSLVSYGFLIYQIFYRHHSDQDTRHNSNRHRKRIIILLGILIAVFTVCWAPITLYWAVVASGATEMDTKIYQYCTIPCLGAGTLNITCSMNSKSFIKRLFCPFRKHNTSSLAGSARERASTITTEI